MSKKALAPLIIVLAGAVPPAAAQTAVPYTTALIAGPSAVGFRRDWVVDATRRWRFSDSGTAGQTGRPLRIDVWYPIDAPAKCRPAALRDYLHADPPDSYFGLANRALEKWDSDSYNGFAAGLKIPVDSLLSLRSRSCLGAEPSGAPHPLIVYSGGWFNRSADNSGLGEYLASHGYVVAEVPLLGDGLWTGDLRSSPAALETQVGDIEAALRLLVGRPWVDRTRIASMGYSSGGIVALLTALRNPQVHAVVGLDPSYMGAVDRVFGAPYYRADRMRVPLLTLRSGNALFTSRKRSEVVDSLKFADRYTADVGNGSHGDFGDDVLIEIAARVVRTSEPRPAADGLAAYRATANAVRLFLDATLKGRRAALDEMTSDRSVLRWLPTATRQGP
jgi:dienelactone hydrolase